MRGIAQTNVNPGGQGITGVTMYVTMKPVITMKAIESVPRDVKMVGQGITGVTTHVTIKSVITITTIVTVPRDVD